MMMRVTKGLLFLLMGVAALLVGPAALSRCPWSVFAADGPQKAEPAGDSGGKDSADDETGDDDDGGVTFFPGVRGISGKELERVIKERERRKQEEERRSRRYAPNRTERPAEPEKPSETRPPELPKPKPAPAVAETEPLGGEARDFLRKLTRQTDRAEALLEKINELRSDAEADARKVGNEALIHYILQYTKRSTKETRAYQGHIKFAVAVYRYVYEQTMGGLKFARSQRPDEELPKAASAEVEGYVARLHAVRRAALLATAELYTLMRQFAPAEIIYKVLLRECPKDRAIRQSHQAMVKIKDTPKPAQPPGVRAGGGNSERHYGRDDDDDDDDGESRPEDRYKRRYGL